MPLTVGERGVRPLTADEVMRMVAAGILSEDEPVELLHGVLTQVSPKSPAHGEILSRLLEWLAPSRGRAYRVRTEHPLIVPDGTSLPEPDLSVLERGGDPSEHPRTALLVIEVAVTSLDTDTTIKPPLYAAAGVPELWVVDVERRRVEVFAEPRPGDGYARRVAFAAPASIVPVAIEIAPLALADLFRGL